MRGEASVIERATEEVPASSGVQESGPLSLTSVSGVRGALGAQAEADGRPRADGAELEAERLGAWRGLVDSLPVALLLLDSSFRVEFANSAFVRSFAELEAGDDVDRFFPRAELEAARARLHAGGAAHVLGRAMTRKGPLLVGLDLTIVRSSAKEYVCIACQAGVLSDGGRRPSPIAVEDLPPSRLSAVQRQAVTTNLAAAVAHEVNNMLSVIMASAELASRGLDRAQDPKDDLERVGEASERAAEVLGDLLRFLGKRGEQVEEIEPGKVLHDLSRLVESGVRRGIQLRLRLEATPPVRVVRSHFEASVLGLIDNAREALGGSGSISLVTEQRQVSEDEARALDLPTGRYASIRVSDSGPGMCSEVLARASDPYFTTKAKIAGAGLGLTAVRAFARASDGGFLLTSAPGRGTTAELLLPLAATSPGRNQPS